MHLSGYLHIRNPSARKDDLPVVYQLAYAKVLQVEGEIRQSTLDCISGVIQAGVLVGRDAFAPL